MSLHSDHIHNVATTTTTDAAHNHGMATSFEFNVHSTLLFSFFQTHNIFQFSLLLVILFACGIGREWFSSYRRTCLRTGGRTNVYGFKKHATLLYISVYIIDMILMLAIMSFNIAIFAVLIAGVGVGHYWYWDASVYQKLDQNVEDDKVTSCC